MSYQQQAYNPYASGINSGQQPNQGVPYGSDPEAGVPKREFGFDNQLIRVKFIRKVFSMVAVMLGVVTIMTAIPFLSEATMHYIRDVNGNGRALYLLSYVVFIVVYIVLMCCEGVRRAHPTNLILTGILTLSIGYMTMMLASFHKLDAVLMTLVITTLSCGGVILFSMQTRIDFTKMIGFACIAGLVLFVFGLVAITSVIFFKVKFLYTIYAGLGALLVMFYLAIDIQMLMGGRKIELSPEEHIYASLQIFLDIVMVFWFILSLIGGGDH